MVDGVFGTLSRCHIVEHDGCNATIMANMKEELHCVVAGNGVACHTDVYGLPIVSNGDWWQEAGS